jgi:mannose-1-phosphate guanylyltransferase/mannose-6-phosphate isomerase
MVKIVPVILSGGTGSRLWPLSREAYPKQLRPLVGSETMLQATVARVSDGERFEPPIIVANTEHRFLIAEQLRHLPSPPRIVLEPEGRNTAPAVAVAALLAAKDDPDALILAMPADHVIGDIAAFHDALATGGEAALRGQLVLFGVRPTKPETGYGYIKVGAPSAGAPGVHQVERFAEKPDCATARKYVSEEGYVWNSGIFLLPTQAFLEELQRFAPDVLSASKQAVNEATTDLDFLRLGADEFRASPSISVDYAVMERTTRAAVVPVSFAWSDVGAWSALWDIAEKDSAGNAVIGEAVIDGASNCYVRGEGQLVTAIGVQDLVIVGTADAVLVTTRAADQDVKRMVDRLRASGREVATQTQRVSRPWGYYQSLHVGERFQVKRISVLPGAKLSLQKHFHRAEHWVVVNGTALVTRDEEQVLLKENESIFLPVGCVHRLENPGCAELNLIEVQSGPYLGEDDIVRLDDVYART